MTNSTRQIAAGFTASAFLKPKHLPAATLFEWVDDDELKKLKPPPESVRDAILECKKHGLSARFAGGLSLSISGDAVALYTCFGVRLMSDSDPEAVQRDWFEDDDGKKHELVEPVARHPLGKWIVGIIVELDSASMDAWPPSYPNDAPSDWGKQAPYHIWPWELRERIGGTNLPSGDSSSPSRIGVALIDTAVDLAHRFFNEKRQIPPQAHAFDFSINKHSLEIITDYLQKRMLEVEEGLQQLQYPPIVKRLKRLDSLVELLKTDKESADSKPTGIPNAYSSLRDYLDAGIDHELYEIKRELINDPAIRPERWDAQKWAKELQSDDVFAKQFLARLDQLCEEAGTRGPLNSLDKFKDIQQQLIGDFVTEAKNAIERRWNQIHGEKDTAMRKEKAQSLQREKEWITKFTDSQTDHLGTHGTAMAASLVGVSPTTPIIAFGTISRDAKKSFEGLTGPTSSEVFKAAIAECNKLNQDPPIPSEPHSSSRTVKYRIVSNSYGSAIPLQSTHQTMETQNIALNNLKSFIQNEGKRYLILFASGNKGNPKDDSISRYNLLNSLPNVITIGGAWDQGPSEPRMITLSNASHAHNIIRGDKEHYVPDICGLVGRWQNEAVGSPYVYLPGGMTREESARGWNYFGGGTSSACAQVAGLCGELLSRYPEMDIDQIRTCLIEGGDDVTEGESHTGESIDTLNTGRLQKIRLANMDKAFDIANTMTKKMR